MNGRLGAHHGLGKRQHRVLCRKPRSRACCGGSGTTQPLRVRTATVSSSVQVADDSVLGKVKHNPETLRSHVILSDIKAMNGQTCPLCSHLLS
ncbi:hypothetical protein PoB_004744400 [Plakobranchus ocellatus]|uniref:Uncharacterized protein n=1 Tax=Plakobranchus ocellatus TaxID=259542 RepID=A0AAV4BRG0_9GAST|nr:hypothetical protein PoB_004744400 [Plakobranchus ocellatus]